MDRLRSAPPWAGFVAAVAVVATIQLAAAAEYLFHGGLFTDDWPIASLAHFDGIDGLWESLTAANRERPLGMLYLTLTGVASGTNPELHALWGYLTHVACVVAVFYLVRALGMPLAPAAAVALLVILFPYSDSVWLWYAASHASLAIALGAGGTLLALRGLRAERAWPWHLAAATAFAASVLTYQVIAVAVVLTLAVYWSRAGRRLALILWVKDVAAVVAAAFIPALLAGGRGADPAPVVDSVDEAVGHAAEIGDQALTLLANGLVPFGSPDADVVVGLALCVVIGGSAQALWGGPAATAHARRWLGWTMAGAALVVTGFAVYVPANPDFYLPLVGGSGNRINALTGIGYSLIVVALAMLAAGFPLSVRGWRPDLSPILAAVVVLIVAAGYVVQVDEDIGEWIAAADSQGDQLAELERLGRPPSGTTDYVHGGLGATANGVFAFRTTWDLNNAVRLLWDDPELQAFPVFDGTRMVCRRLGMYPEGPAHGIGLEQGSAYPDLFFTDLRNGERVRIHDRAACRRQARRFDPGPVGG